MVEIIRTSVSANVNSLILLFVFCTLVGFFLAMSTLSWNKEKKKKGFKKNRLFGKERKYDKELYREYLNMEHNKFKDSYKDYLEDEMEYHANKKF